MSPPKSWPDGLATIEALVVPSIEACLPPHVPVPRHGPCPGARRGIAKPASPKATAVSKARTATPPGVAALPRTSGRAESASTAAKHTNPAYGMTSGLRQPVYPEQGRTVTPWTPELGPLPARAFELNCTNVILAWDMRMRGFDVQAAPSTIIDKYGYGAGRTNAGLDQLLIDAYRLPNGAPHGRSFFGINRRTGRVQTPWRSFAEIDAEIERDWPEGGRGIIMVGRHVFNVAKVSGKARYIEAQSAETASRNVTSKYKARYRQRYPSNTVEEGKLLRTDDLVPADGILPSVSTKEQTRQYAEQQQLTRP